MKKEYNGFEDVYDKFQELLGTFEANSENHPGQYDETSGKFSGFSADIFSDVIIERDLAVNGITSILPASYTQVYGSMYANGPIISYEGVEHSTFEVYGDLYVNGAITLRDCTLVVDGYLYGATAINLDPKSHLWVHGNPMNGVLYFEE